MRIRSILNNNAVVVRLKDGREAIIMQKGIGFSLHVGDRIAPSDAQKVFVLKNDEASRHFKELAVEVPSEVFELCQDIYQKLDAEAGGALAKSLFITLTDHVANSIARLREGVCLQNLMVWDTRLLYPEEYRQAEWVCNEIRRKLYADYPLSEAATIAMHIVNAENQQNKNVADTIIEVQAILRIIRFTMMTDFDIESLSYYRFMIHLKLLLERVRNNVHADTRLGADLYGDILKKYPKEYRCAQKIAAYFADKYRYTMCHDEIIFLMLHINRLMDSTINEQPEA